MKVDQIHNDIGYWNINFLWFCIVHQYTNGLAELFSNLNMPLDILVHFPCFSITIVCYYSIIYISNCDSTSSSPTCSCSSS